MNAMGLKTKKDWTGEVVVSLDAAIAVLVARGENEARVRGALLAQQTTPGTSVPLVAVRAMLDDSGVV